MFVEAKVRKLLKIHHRQVELEGLEPSSKRGINLLSTCLSSFQFSTQHPDEATSLSSLVPYFIQRPELPSDYLRYCCTTCSDRFEATAPGDVSFQLLEKE